MKNLIKTLTLSTVLVLPAIVMGQEMERCDPARPVATSADGVSEKEDAAITDAMKGCDPARPVATSTGRVSAKEAAAIDDFQSKLKSGELTQGYTSQRLRWAADDNHPELAERLLKVPGDVRPTQDSINGACAIAAGRNHTDMFEFFLARPEINQRGIDDSLRSATYANNEPLVVRILGLPEERKPSQQSILNLCRRVCPEFIEVELDHAKQLGCAIVFDACSVGKELDEEIQKGPLQKKIDDLQKLKVKPSIIAMLKSSLDAESQETLNNVLAKRQMEGRKASDALARRALEISIGV